MLLDNDVGRAKRADAHLASVGADGVQETADGMGALHAVGVETKVLDVGLEEVDLCLEVILEADDVGSALGSPGIRDGLEFRSFEASLFVLRLDVLVECLAQRELQLAVYEALDAGFQRDVCLVNPGAGVQRRLSTDQFGPLNLNV